MVEQELRAFEKLSHPLVFIGANLKTKFGSGIDHEFTISNTLGKNPGWVAEAVDDAAGREGAERFREATPFGDLYRTRPQEGPQRHQTQVSQHIER